MYNECIMASYQNMYIEYKKQYLYLKYNNCRRGCDGSSGGGKKLRKSKKLNNDNKELNNLINFPFDKMSPKYSKMDVKWVIGDKDNGEKMPTKDLRKMYNMLDKIYYYKEGWGLNLKLPFNNDDSEPCILLGKLKNDVYIYIYSTTDYTGYECLCNYFEVIYSHDLENLYKYGITDKVRSIMYIVSDTIEY